MRVAVTISPRQSEILALLRGQEQVDVDSLSKEFDVSTQTIRHDLRVLTDLGLAARTHGGVKRVISASNQDYTARRALNAAAKATIAARIAALIPNDCSVILNIGTTTEHVARALQEHRNLIVLTNNINIINILMGDPSKELVLVGGAVRQSDGAIVGGDAVDYLNRYKADYAVIGTSAMDDDGSATDFDPREVDVARAILRNARTKILACDASKFQNTAPVRICHIGDVDYFVTDQTPMPQFQEAARTGETTILEGSR